MQIHNKGMNSSNNEGVTKFRVSLDKKCMKNGYDIGQLQKSGKTSLHFGISPIWGLKLTIRKLNIGMVEKMAFKTQTETVTPPPLHFRP